jgi:hypothetical protein
MKKIKILAREDDRGELIVDSDKRIRVWLVWSLAEYQNGVPMLDLRAIATSLKQAEKYKDLLEKDFLKDKDMLRSWKLKTDIKINIEERITNHCYGLSMSLLDHILYPER